MRLARVIDWFARYPSSVNGPDPTIPSVQRWSAVFRALADETRPSEKVDVACRNWALGCLNETSAVSSSTTLVPVYPLR